MANMHRTKAVHDCLHNLDEHVAAVKVVAITVTEAKMKTEMLQRTFFFIGKPFHMILHQNYTRRVRQRNTVSECSPDA